jgi:hypothetical protein
LAGNGHRLFMAFNIQQEESAHHFLASPSARVRVWRWPTGS